MANIYLNIYTFLLINIKSKLLWESIQLILMVIIGKYVV